MTTLSKNPPDISHPYAQNVCPGVFEATDQGRTTWHEISFSPSVQGEKFSGQCTMQKCCAHHASNRPNSFLPSAYIREILDDMQQNFEGFLGMICHASSPSAEICVQAFCVQARSICWAELPEVLNPRLSSPKSITCSRTPNCLRTFREATRTLPAGSQVLSIRVAKSFIIDSK